MGGKKKEQNRLPYVTLPVRGWAGEARAGNRLIYRKRRKKKKKKVGSVGR